MGLLHFSKCFLYFPIFPIFFQVLFFLYFFLFLCLAISYFFLFFPIFRIKIPVFNSYLFPIYFLILEIQLSGHIHMLARHKYRVQGYCPSDPKRDIIQIMENQMEKNTHNEMDTGIV